MINHPCFTLSWSLEVCVVFYQGGKSPDSYFMFTSCLFITDKNQLEVGTNFQKYFIEGDNIRIYHEERHMR